MVSRAVVFGLLVTLAGCTDPAGDPDDVPSRTMAPDVGFSKDESADHMTVVSVAHGVVWQEFVVQGSGFQHGVDGATRLPGQAPGSGEMGTGDLIAFCATTATRDAHIRVIHPSTNTQVYETEFATLAAC